MYNFMRYWSGLLNSQVELADNDTMKKRRLISAGANETGLTVVELVFAGVVLMGAVITMISMFDTAVDILRYTTSRSLATQIANEQMEDIRSLSYEQAFLTNPATWPDDPNLETSGDPVTYEDVSDDSSTTIPYSLVTSTTATGIQVEQSIQRQRINFLIRRYVMWADDGISENAYKRLIVKVSWVKPYIPGEVVLTTNFAEETEVESRPTAKILGVRSTNFNYFTAEHEETTMGAGDAIRGPNSPEVAQPVVWTEAVITGAKANYIDRVEYDLYRPDGDIVLETTVNSTSVEGGRYFKWGYSITPDTFDTDALPDGAGYLIRAEAFDDKGQSDVAALSINIDNTVPADPSNLDVQFLPDTSQVVQITWDWEPAVGDDLPELSRFIVQRSTNQGLGFTDWNMTPVGTERSFIDPYLGDNARYWYYVTAVDTAGNVSQREEKEKAERTGYRSDVIDPTLSTSATGQAVSWKMIELELEQTTDTGGSGLAGYVWWSREENGPWAIIMSSLDTVTDPLVLYDTGLKPGKTYQYTSAPFDFDANLTCCWPPSPYTGIMITTPMR